MAGRVQLGLNLRNIRALYNKTNELKALAEHGFQQHQLNDKSVRFLFRSTDPIAIQIKNFQIKVSEGNWNGQLVFLGFKGAFKIEYWTVIEEALRSLSQLVKLTFVDTQMDKEHLDLLHSLIKWIDPKEISLKFKQNELDDADLEEFVLRKFLPNFGKRMKTFQIVSNPGIFKGHFVSLLRGQLAKLSVTDPAFEYRLIKNGQTKAVAFARLPKGTPDKDPLILKLENSINQTYYYELNLRGCFTEDNNKACHYLIDQSYDEDKLEQLEYLDIGDCTVGAPPVFESMCAKIATSKGLLHLGLRGQVHIQDSVLLGTLMGDRYDQLRLNHIDIGANEDMVERCIMVLADHLIARSLKTIDVEGSMGQHLPVLVKIMYITEAFIVEQKRLSQIMKRDHFIPKLNIRKLDLVSVETYNRHDLVEAFLQAVVFTEFSACRQLAIQNLDIGRLEAYVKVAKDFQQRIRTSKDPLYKDFRCKLVDIRMARQVYRMEATYIKQLLETIFFTTTQDMLNIKKVTFDSSCFSMYSREEGLKDFLESVQTRVQTEPNVKYTVTDIAFNGSSAYNINETFSLLFQLIFSKNIDVESLSFKDDYFNCGFPKILELGETFLSTTPTLWTLKKLTFEGINSAELDIFDLLRLLVFTEKVHIEELTVLKCSLSINEENQVKLQALGDSRTTPLHLQKLTIGNLYGSNSTVDAALVTNLIVHPMSNLKELNLQPLALADHLEAIRTRLYSLKVPMLKQLKSLTIDSYGGDFTEVSWETFFDILLYSQDTCLESISFKSMSISQILLKGMEKSNEKLQDYLKEKQQSMVPFHLKSLHLEDCTLDAEIFSLFFNDIQCQIESLTLLRCYQLGASLTQLKQVYEKEPELLDLATFALKEVVLDSTTFDSVEIFDWFFTNIVFNKKNQQMRTLSMQGIGLQNEHMQVLNRILNDLKAHQRTNELKSYMQLRNFNLSQNSEIAYRPWKDFFDRLFSAFDVSEEDMFENDKEDEKMVTIDEQVNQEKIDKKEQLSELVCQKVTENRLCVPKLLISQPKLARPPTQLQRLYLKLAFESEEDPQKLVLYTRILKGLVFFPGSQVKDLTFDIIKLPLFIQAVDDAVRSFDEQSGPRVAYPIKTLTLKTINDATDDLLSQLAKLCTQTLSLDSLELEGLSSGNFGKFLLGGQCRLKSLKLIDVESSLDEAETFKFLSSILFNVQSPMETILIGQLFKLNSSAELQENLRKHLIAQNYRCPLKSFTLKTDGDENTKLTLARLMPLLIEGVLIKLDELSVSSSASTDMQLFEEVDPDHLVNFSVSKLELDTYLTLTLPQFKILHAIRPKLTMLTLGKLSPTTAIAEIDEYLSSVSLDQKFDKPAKLHITMNSSYGQVPEILRTFVFGRAFKWDEVTINTLEVFEYLANLSFTTCCLTQPYRHLRYLRFNMGLYYNNSEQLSEEGLRAIGTQLIYDERSVLEELTLHQCHLKPAGLEALTSGAQEFRERAVDKSKVQLSLKRFNIYYSLYVEEEGAERITRDILYFEYIAIERFELQVTNFSSAMMVNMCNHAKAWLKFQADNNRSKKYLPLKFGDWGRNEFVQSKEAWDLFCDTFILSDNTPNLEVLNIHFMSMKDEQVEYLCSKAAAYFNSKPAKYVYPVKRLNFMLNTALSAQGWRQISQGFFFSKKVRLEELNLMSTMLDSPEKLGAIQQSVIDRALTEPSKKLPLHTLLTYNISLKQSMAEYMSIRPADYAPLEDVPVAIDECFETGAIDGLPESFGAITSIITRTLYNSPFVKYEKWTDQYQVRFSEFHVDIAQGLLLSASKLFQTNPNFNGHLPLDIKTCDQLATIFDYHRNKGEPYPYQMFFTPEANAFYASKASLVRTLNFVQTSCQNHEMMDQFQVLDLWEQVKSSKTSLDVVYIDYKLDDELPEKMFKLGYTERDIVNLVRLFPPSKMRLQDTLTLPALKGIYSCMWDNYQFQYANILYDKDIFLNVGIGYALRESVYRSDPTTIFGRCFKRVFYSIFNFFVSGVAKYKFDEQIKQLNNFLFTQKKFFYILTILTLLWYAVCVAGPFIWQHYIVGDSDHAYICKNGITPYAVYTYAGFALFSFLAEAYLYIKVSQIIPDHIKGLVDATPAEPPGNAQPKGNLNQVAPTNKLDNSINNDDIKSRVLIGDDKEEENARLRRTPSPTPATGKPTPPPPPNKLKQMTTVLQSNLTTFAKSKHGRMIGYLKDLGVGQLAKFDLFNDISFILTAYYCDLTIVALLALIVSGYNVVFQLYDLLKFIVVQCMQDSSQAKLLSTKYINDFFSISHIGRNIALTQVLDDACPYNVTVISNNFFTRALVPQIAGKSMSNSVKGYLVKFALEDVPQIILQTYYIVVIALRGSGLTIAIYITIVNSCVSLLISFIKFMSIRPSTISLEDFDKLSDRMEAKITDNQLAFIQTEQDIIQALTGSTKTKNNDPEEENLIKI